MISRSDIRAEARRLTGFFQAAGALPVEADILQPADTLLDLYGEDIRARAYVTHDPLRGELMLRPDFTVPVVLHHMQNGKDEARYTYMGEVFRQQAFDPSRPSEYVQTGYELFSSGELAAADAEVFALFQEVLSPLGLRAATGDIGILMAAVRGLATSEARKRALQRHIWRPRRFRALLDRYGGKKPTPVARKALLQAVAEGKNVLADSAPHIGLRDVEEIEARIRVLVQDAAEPPISPGEAEMLDEILNLRETAPMVLERLRDLSVDLAALAPAVEQFARRLDALALQGVDADSLEFEGSYGRTTMEYYDGFVFGFYAADRPDLPAVATGGRYDALTGMLRRKDNTGSFAAVGGVIRPELVLELKRALA